MPYHAMHWGRVPSVHGMYYPVLAWSIQLLAYAMPSVPVPPIMSLTWGFSGGGARVPARSVLPSDIVPVRSWTRTLRRPGIRHRHLPCHAMPRVCYRRCNQWLRLVLASFCLPLTWLARVVCLLVGVAEGWGGRRGHAHPCAVLGHAICVTVLALG